MVIYFSKKDKIISHTSIDILQKNFHCFYASWWKERKRVIIALFRQLFIAGQASYANDGCSSGCIVT